MLTILYNHFRNCAEKYKAIYKTVIIKKKSHFVKRIMLINKFIIA